MNIPTIHCNCGKVMSSSTLCAENKIHSISATCDCGIHIGIDFANNDELPTRLEGSE